ncbi:MAG TPA: cytochrome c peroxidase [Flavipsychrobacter sp.]|nr:cytochrome c peroxidase [Flavipsychrobacter sp.]
MKKIIIGCIALLVCVLSFSFKDDKPVAYLQHYQASIQKLKDAEAALLQLIRSSELNDSTTVKKIRSSIAVARREMKAVDIWLRYLEPIAHKKINGPLPVEWETEVFEKFEKPYKREGAGLTLAALYLDEENATPDSLASLIGSAIQATDIYTHDSITRSLETYHHFFLCNRLFLLNLAAIYTTGFECPDGDAVIPELKDMIRATRVIYQSFNEGFPATPLTKAYLDLYDATILFCSSQPDAPEKFDHFSFIRDYVNPLFILNQGMIKEYKVVSKSMVDYAINKNATSIFSKTLYNGQNSKGIFVRVNDANTLRELESIGKLLFYDPILSGNNERSCASCHNPQQYFTDTSFATPFDYDHISYLKRNTPSLINSQYNHLIMMDGKHYTLQHQTKAVVTNAKEMGGEEQGILEKILSCKDYKKAFTKLLPFTPQENEITFEHIASAITYYYSKFSVSNAPFDLAMNQQQTVSADVKQGFNLFMSKAQCATCHFVPQFNGVKPPYIGSEFEVLGVPEHKDFKKLSGDNGRYDVNPAYETRHAFRTGSLRNSAHTMPYMHNGVFKTMDEVIEFYNNGGGVGAGLDVVNQTLSADSLKLNTVEKKQLVQFINALDETIIFEKAPVKLPSSDTQALNKRKVGGVY